MIKKTLVFFQALLVSVVCDSTTFAKNNPTFIRRVRSIETEELGAPNPAGLSFSFRDNTFHVLVRRQPDQPPPSVADILVYTPIKDPAGSVRIAAEIKDPINMAFDNKANRLLIFKSAAKQLIEVLAGPDGNLNPSTLTHHNARHFGLQNPQGMTVDPESGHLFILDATGPRLIRVEPELDGGFENAVISELDLALTGLIDPRGLALDSTTGHFYALSPDKQKLYELTETGQLVTTRDVFGYELQNPQGMVIARSGDLTDDPSQVSLYIADSGLSAQEALSPSSFPNGQIMELSFSEAQAPAASTFQATLEQTIDTSQFSPPSPDPAGITYIDSSDTLLISDSEVNEMPIFTGDNLFEMSLSGALVDTLSTISFSNEPTGVTYNPVNGHLFISDDNAREIFEVNPGPDGLYDTPDDIISSFDTVAFLSSDPEGVAYDSLQGVLFITDGLNNEIYRVAPGTNGIFDGPPPAGDDQVSSFDTANLGVLDPEGITFDLDNGHLYLVGEPKIFLAHVTTTGTLVRRIDISDAEALVPAGLAYCPGSANSSEMSIYITDRRVDNNSNPDENDGKVYEMSIPPITPGNLPPVVDAGLDQTITLPETASLHGTVTDEGLPNPPGMVSTSWSQVSGAGMVTFADNSAVDTTISFSIAGIYVLRLTADDGELKGSDEVTVVVNGDSGVEVIDVRVASGSDDAEERVTGSVNLASSDLELVFDGGGNQTVGLRFNSVSIPYGANISNAYVQFQADEVNSESTSLTVEGENVDNAETFISAVGNISSRPRTVANVSWSPNPWLMVGEANVDQRTPDIVSVIQEIVNRPGWSSGNSLVIIITGNGERTAESFDGVQNAAPLLHVEFTAVPCEGDIEPPGAPDADVDGLDLSTLIQNPALLDLADFAADFGRTNCP